MNEIEPALPRIEIPDLNLPPFIELKNSVLNVENIPDVAVTMLSLKAMGFSLGRIASILSTPDRKISRSLVADYCNRYDPNGLCNVSKEDKRVLTTQMLQTTAIAALMEITQNKLAISEAKDLAAIASRCATTAEKLSMVDGMKDEKKTGRISAMMDALDVGEEE